MPERPYDGVMRTLMVVGILALSACGQGTDASTNTEVSPAVSSPVASTTLLDSTATTETAEEPPENESSPAIENSESDGCAHVIGAAATDTGDGTFSISATVSSDETGWDKYADLWTVSVDGEVIGERVLAHPHESEQPFTRSLSGVVIPDGTTVLEIAAHDSVLGFCGDVFELEL